MVPRERSIIVTGPVTQAHATPIEAESRLDDHVDRSERHRLARRLGDAEGAWHEGVARGDRNEIELPRRGDRSREHDDDVASHELTERVGKIELAGECGVQRDARRAALVQLTKQLGRHEAGGTREHLRRPTRASRQHRPAARRLVDGSDDLGWARHVGPTQERRASVQNISPALAV